jgi:hypothetical protein
MIISDKDRRLPLLKDFAGSFTYNGQPLGRLKIAELA